MRLFLLTMLAIAVSAKYEFNPTHVAAIKNDIDTRLDKTGDIVVKNMDNNVQWRAQTAVRNEIWFDITNLAALGDECGNGPAITIDNGPNHCLYRVTFFLEKDTDLTPTLELGLLFRHHNNAENIRMVLSRVFKPPVNPGEDRWTTLRLQPFNNNHLNRRTFSAPVAWVRNILDAGVYAGKISTRNSESEGDTEDTEEVLQYTAHPVIINEDTLRGILRFKN